MFLNSHVFLSNQFPFNCYKTGLSLMYYEIIIRYGEHIRKIKLLDCFLITFVIYYWAVRISSIGIDYGFRYLHLHWNYRLRSSHTSQMFFFLYYRWKIRIPPASYLVLSGEYCGEQPPFASVSLLLKFWSKSP